MIDDIERQLQDATRVAAAVVGVLDDALGELKAVRTDLEGAVRRAGERGLHIDGDGAVSPTMVHGQCKVNEKGSDDAKAIEAAQHEIVEIVKRGIAADQDLSFSLMSDIGVGLWFSAKPQHQNIDTTNTIGYEECNALNRAIQGKSPYRLPDSDDPYDLGFGRLLGEGPRERNYEAGDRMTELIRSSESMKQLRADTLQEWRAQGNAKGTVHYSISDGGRAGALKKLVLPDIPAIVTGDPDHIGEVFVGSYSLDYDVRGQDPDGSLVVQYKLKNATSNESFPHYLGLRLAQENEPGRGRPLHRASGDHLDRTHPGWRKDLRMTRTLGALAGAATLCLLAFDLTGCGYATGSCTPPEASAADGSDLAGTYWGRHAAKGVRLTLALTAGRNGGTLTVENWPTGDYCRSELGDTFEGSGTWGATPARTRATATPGPPLLHRATRLDVRRHDRPAPRRHGSG